MRPLILDFKIPRLESENPITYEYDALESLNVITVDGKNKPFIDLQTDDLLLTSKTRVARETDDERFLIEIKSKTEQARERDDPQDNFLELSTKTFSQRERDDERISMLEMITKTKIQRESDDHNFIDYQQN